MSDPNKTSAEGVNEENPAEEAPDSALTLKGGMAMPSVGWTKDAQGFLSDVRSEFQKITWPTRQQVMTETAVVLVVVFFLTTLITVFDWIFSQIANRFLV